MRRWLFAPSPVHWRQLCTLLVLSVSNINPVRALYWTAVINGLLAPSLLLGILIIASDAKVMSGQTSSILGKAVVGLTTVAMFIAAMMLWL
jgi:Mn2+/Fe2+ NRAMP family transporter